MHYFHFTDIRYKVRPRKLELALSQPRWWAPSPGASPTHSSQIKRCSLCTGGGVKPVCSPPDGWTAVRKRPGPLKCPCWTQNIWRPRGRGTDGQPRKNGCSSHQWCVGTHTLVCFLSPWEFDSKTLLLEGGEMLIGRLLQPPAGDPARGGTLCKGCFRLCRCRLQI